MPVNSSPLPVSSPVSHWSMQPIGVYPVHEKPSSNMMYPPPSTTNHPPVNNLVIQHQQYLSTVCPPPAYSSSSTTTTTYQHLSSSHFQTSAPSLGDSSSTPGLTSTAGLSSTITCSPTNNHNQYTSSQPLSATLTNSPAMPANNSQNIATPIPASLVNFQIDPQTGMPLSIINSQNCAMLKSNTTVTTAPNASTDNFENKPSGMLLTSRDPVLSAVPIVSESPISTPPSQPLTVTVPPTSSLSVSSPPLLSPSLMSPGLLSPSRHYSLLSPSELRKTSQQGTGLSGLGSVKVSLLREPAALPQPPDPPQPPCPVEKLSPPTPSIRVSIIFIL